MSEYGEKVPVTTLPALTTECSPMSQGPTTIALSATHTPSPITMSQLRAVYVDSMRSRPNFA